MPFLYRLASLLIALLVLPVQAAEMRVALLRTSGVETLDALTVDGGSWVRRVPLSHTAVLIEHHAATLLFDTGLGRDIDAQFPRRHALVGSAAVRLPESRPGARPTGRSRYPRRSHPAVPRTLGSRLGPGRLPEVPVWAPYEEIAFSRIATPPAAFPSQFRHGVRWRPYSFDPRPFMGFDEASTCLATAAWCWSPARPYARLGRSVRHPRQRAPAVLQRRHQLATRRRRRPTAEILRRPRPGRSRSRAHLAQLAKIRLLLRSDPRLSVIPAHDARVQAALGYFPHWLE